MGKHVCPVCEDVYATPADVLISTVDRRINLDGWGCPACGYVFVGVPDAAAAVEKLGQVSVHHSAVLHSTEVHHRGQASDH